MTEKKTRRSFVASRQAWHALSEEVRRTLSTSPYGQRIDAIAQLQAKLGVSGHVVRRILNARDFTDRVGEVDPVLAEELKGQPMTCVCVLRRWSLQDQDAAMAGARDLIAGRAGLKTLTDMERKARKAGERLPKSPANRAWQTSASLAVTAAMATIDPSAELAWSARGWGPEGAPKRRTPPKALAKLSHLPAIHMAFENKKTGEQTLASVLSNQIVKERPATTVAQVVILLNGYARMGCRAILFCDMAADLKAARQTIREIGHPDGLLALPLTQAEKNSEGTDAAKLDSQARSKSKRLDESSKWR